MFSSLTTTHWILIVGFCVLAIVGIVSLWFYLIRRFLPTQAILVVALAVFGPPTISFAFGQNTSGQIGSTPLPSAAYIAAAAICLALGVVQLFILSRTDVEMSVDAAGEYILARMQGESRQSAYEAFSKRPGVDKYILKLVFLIDPLLDNGEGS